MPGFVRIDGRGRPLVLLHGVGLDHTMWDAVVELLVDHHTMVRYDLIGHGRSPDRPGPRQLADFVDQLVEVLDAQGLEQCALAGLSMGAMVAKAFARDHPERCDRVALCHAVHRRSSEQAAAVGRRLEAAERLGMAAVTTAALDRWFTADWRESHPAAVENIRTVLEGNDPAAYLKAYRVFATSTAADATLEKVTAPTLILTGDRDTGSTPEMTRAMAAEIPNSQVLVLSGVGHLSAVESPDRVADALRSFLGET